MDGIKSAVPWDLVESKLEHMAEARPKQLLRMHKEGTLVKYLLDQAKACRQTEALLLSQGHQEWQAKEIALSQMCPVEEMTGEAGLGRRTVDKILKETLSKLETFNNMTLHGTPTTSGY